MKKRSYGFFILLALLCAFISIPASAATLTFSSALKIIEEEAFQGDISVTSVVIPEGCASIGARAFDGCERLKRVTIPDSVTFIGEDAFANCPDDLVLSVGIGSYAARYAAGQGLRFELNKASVAASGACGDSATWTLMDSGDLFISGTGKLEDVTMENSLSNPFWGKYSQEIVRVWISDGITALGKHSFACCKALESISLPDSVTEIGQGAFSLCEKLTDVTLPDGIETLGPGCFRYCARLGSVHLPASLKTFERFAFDGDACWPPSNCPTAWKPSAKAVSAPASASGRSVFRHTHPPRRSCL